jgi:hypothetical protein
MSSLLAHFDDAECRAYLHAAHAFAGFVPEALYKLLDGEYVDVGGQRIPMTTARIMESTDGGRSFHQVESVTVPAHG